jgi:hypothetical protein
MENQNPLDLLCPSCSRPLTIARYRCEGCNLTVDGALTVPPLSRLAMTEQAFVIAFVRVHGNLKRMEQLFGISYPTVKSRLNAIARKLDSNFEVPPGRSEILDRLGRGEIKVEEALKLLDQLGNP